MNKKDEISDLELRGGAPECMLLLNTFGFNATLLYRFVLLLVSSSLDPLYCESCGEENERCSVFEMGTCLPLILEFFRLFSFNGADFILLLRLFLCLNWVP